MTDSHELFVIFVMAEQMIRRVAPFFAKRPESGPFEQEGRLAEALAMAQRVMANPPEF